jgi:hypothetical protein
MGGARTSAPSPNALGLFIQQIDLGGVTEMNGDQPLFDLDAFIARLEAEQVATAQALEALRDLRASRAGGSAPTSAAPAGTDRAISPDSVPLNAFFGLRSIREAAKKYLDLVKRKQTTKQIIEGLDQGGFPHKPKNFYNTVYTALARGEEAGEIIRVGSEWAIASWFPGHSRRPKDDPEAKTKREAKKKRPKRNAKPKTRRPQTPKTPVETATPKRRGRPPKSPGMQVENA